METESLNRLGFGKVGLEGKVMGERGRGKWRRVWVDGMREEIGEEVEAIEAGKGSKCGGIRLCGMVH